MEITPNTTPLIDMSVIDTIALPIVPKGIIK